MTYIIQRPRFRTMLAAVLLAVAATVLATTFGTRPAGAAFPGENGKIVYEDLVLSTFDYEISVMNPDGSGRTNLTNDGGDEEKAPPSRGFAGRARQDSNLRPPDS